MKKICSAIYSAIGTEIESGTPAVPGGVSGSVDAGRVGKVSKNTQWYWTHEGNLT